MTVQLIQAVIVLVTLVGVALGRYPWLKMNRATIALVGATALVALGALSLEEAFEAIDLDTLLLIFAMMVINANLRFSGFFNLVVAKVSAFGNSPRQLMLLVVMASGFLSALFLNDTIVLVFTPLVVEITRSLKLPPIPYLMALATSANIGSVATVIGNPQNMLIGTSSGISFGAFAAALTPVAVGGLLIAWAILALVYRKELAPREIVLEKPPTARIRKPRLMKSLGATALMLVLAFIGMPVALAAAVGASFLLVTRRMRPERVFKEIDVTLLVFFASLFVVTASVAHSPLFRSWLAPLESLIQKGPAGLVALGAVLSNLISNVPAVLLLRPSIAALENPEPAWLLLAMSTTLAGNLTLLGSVANLIVAESAARQGVKLSFGAYLKAGLPITLLTLTWGAFWLSR
jgi:Na+/H+ antiporter NhaD/arsenite permease-like protein